MNYWEYINVEKLLSLQRGLNPEGPDPCNDEVLFITVHQVYELWMKLLLQELDSCRALFRRNPVPDQDLAAAVRSLRRCITIFEVATEHWRVVGTLTTRDYLTFRDRLIGASGFQSFQLRELEILLGLDDDKRIACAGESSYKDVLRAPGGGSTVALERVEKRIAEGPSFKWALYDWLARTPIDGSSEQADVDRYVNEFLAAHEAHKQELLAIAQKQSSEDMDIDLIKVRFGAAVDRARAFLEVADRPDLSDEDRVRHRHMRAALVFIESHRELPRLAWPREVIDAVLTLEQKMVIWRQRHARMVERMIGRRAGTGGSGGVAYLDQTALSYRIFDELWMVRTILLRQDSVPGLVNEADYRFRVED